MTRIWELRDRRLSAFRGDYSAYARQREERDARLRREAETRELEIAKEQALVQTYRSQRKHGKMHEHEARLARLDRIERAATPARRCAWTAPSATPAPRSGEVVLRLEDLVVGHPGGPEVARIDPPRGDAGRADRHRRAERRRQDHAAAGDRRASSSRATAASPSGPTSSSATSPRSATTRSSARRSSTRSSARSR